MSHSLSPLHVARRAVVVGGLDAPRAGVGGVKSTLCDIPDIHPQQNKPVRLCAAKASTGGAQLDDLARAHPGRGEGARLCRAGAWLPAGGGGGEFWVDLPGVTSINQ